MHGNLQIWRRLTLNFAAFIHNTRYATFLFIHVGSNVMSLVFQYGSNTSVPRLNSPARLNGAARLIGSACTLDHFELDFTVWSNSNNSAAADIVANGSRQIWGVLYDIPDELIYRHMSDGRTTLDDIEGEGRSYSRISIQVSREGKYSQRESVITYVVRNKQPDLKAGVEYVSHILSGLRSHNIPEEYLAYVKRRILLNNSDLGSLFETNPQGPKSA